MAPSARALEQALAKVVTAIWKGDERDQLSVNLVRKRAEEDLGLEEGFFKSAEWKTRSKEMITGTVDDLEQNGAPPSAPPSPVAAKKRAPRAGTKRASSDEDATPIKKRQKTVQPKKAAAKAASPDPSDLSDVDDETPKKKRKQPAKPGKKRKVEESDLDDVDGDDGDDGEDDFDGESRTESELSEGTASDESASDAKPKKRKAATSKPAPKRQKAAPAKRKDGPEDGSPLSGAKDVRGEDGEKPSVVNVVDDDESELSEVIDEPPRAKRKSKEPSSKGGAKSKAPKTRAGAELPPGEAEIKKLQGQLVKCGIRKLWGIELKGYGDDKAKIRHLSGMLRDAGMDGRFSEARAREIKERKELEADLEAVREMDSHWGISSTGRPSRGRANRKSLKEPSSDEDKDGDGEKTTRKQTDHQGVDEDGDGDDGESEEDVKAPQGRGRGSARYRADLAFLGDSEGESD